MLEEILEHCVKIEEMERYMVRNMVKLGRLNGCGSNEEERVQPLRGSGAVSGDLNDVEIEMI